MSKSFTIPRADVAGATEAALRAEITNATGSEIETDSILRSLERMGTDESIEFYEMILVTSRRAYGGASTNTWRVRADRGEVAEPEILG
jgi:hypothetical protein